jgi:hypothetical protein
MSQQPRLNAQLSGHHTTHVPNANEITFVGQQWQSITPRYYIPKAIIPSWLALIVGYYIKKPIPILNPTTIYSKLECNQLLKLIEISMQLGMKTFTLI